MAGLLALLWLAGPAPAAPDAATAAAEIRRAATESGHPPPLAGSWNTGTLPDGYGPDYQIRLIEQGHHLLPWFQLDSSKGENKLPEGYYLAALKRCAELGLPLSFISTQWEYLLSDDPKYRGLPAAANPNVVSPKGDILPMVSPFGPVEPWREIGQNWTGTPILKTLQAAYPDPPLVLFVSNNEHRKLVWNDAVLDRRYPARSGSGYCAESRREAVGQGWIERYRALQTGMRNSLDSPEWRKVARFVGYDAFGSPAFGRWPGWEKYSLFIKGRVEPWPLAWDGASLPYYLNDWEGITDYSVWSPEIQAMNWVFMREEAERLNPGFFLELSVWDGYQPGGASDKRAALNRLGPAYTPERYAGWVKFGMWLLRPRVVREYRGYAQTRADTERYFLALLDAVDEIHRDGDLGGFWRSGTLVANGAHGHPYQTLVPEEYRAAPRWFLLDTALDPRRPWDLDTELPVFALALVKGEAPDREWLVYAFAPRGDYPNVTVTLPGFGPVAVEARPKGGYRIVKERHD